MTKLMEWLSVFGTVFAVWLSFVLGWVQSNFVDKNFTLVLCFPVIAVILFGIYAATVVLYRTFTFNNCEEAAEELKKQIELAKEDLTTKGFVFKT